MDDKYQPARNAAGKIIYYHWPAGEQKAQAMAPECHSLTVDQWRELPEWVHPELGYCPMGVRGEGEEYFRDENGQKYQLALVNGVLHKQAVR